MKCNHDCLHCLYPDCIDDEITDEELLAVDALDTGLREKILHHRYYMNHREEWKAYSRKYKDMHRDECNRKHREYYQKNREQQCARQRAYGKRKRAEKKILNGEIK